MVLGPYYGCSGSLLGPTFHKKNGSLLGPYLKAWGSLLVLETVETVLLTYSGQTPLMIFVFQGKWRPASLQWRAQPMGMLKGWRGLAWRWTRHQMDSYTGKIIWNSAFSPLCWFRQPWENPWIMNGIGLLFADMHSQGIGITALSSILQTSKSFASIWIIMQSQNYPQPCQFQRTRIWEMINVLQKRAASGT